MRRAGPFPVPFAALPLAQLCLAPIPLALIVLAALLVAPLSPSRSQSGPLDSDPLRRFLPSPDVYMPVPGGQLGLTRRRAPDATIEEIKAEADGGIVVGYCLRASCSHITHLVVLQVCGNAVGGPGGADQLVLGIVRLPYGRTPGYIQTLQGRDYATNFATYGPARQVLPATDGGEDDALLALSTVGMGPVAPLVFEGAAVARTQSRETLALQLVVPRDGGAGLQNARVEVRHLCRKHVS